MEVALLSGVVRNRKVTNTPQRARASSFDRYGDSGPSQSFLSRLYVLLRGDAWLRHFSLRVHKFTFQWDIFLHLSVFLLSLLPFAFTSERIYAVFPISVWAIYNVLFLIGARRANQVFPGFGRFRLTFQASIEEFFSPKVLPIFSISFLCVVLSLTVTGHMLGGAPLCYRSCGECLATWSHSIKNTDPLDASGCGYSNGEELLSLYTLAQTSFMQFVVCVGVLAMCLAWRVAEEELRDRKSAEDWLKTEDLLAFHLREGIIKTCGAPASAVRPEGNATWVFFGVIAALSFTLLGWHNWEGIPPSYSATLVIILNLLVILLSSLILHLGFFGRIISLYRRNFQRVECLTAHAQDLADSQIDAWWNCRSFVLNEDLALDYDIGGLAVYREGFKTMLEPPGSYCAYACLYLTMCLIRIFTLATSTFEEQQSFAQGGMSPKAKEASFDDMDFEDYAEYVDEESVSTTIPPPRNPLSIINNTLSKIAVSVSSNALAMTKSPRVSTPSEKQGLMRHFSESSSAINQSLAPLNISIPPASSTVPTSSSGLTSPKLVRTMSMRGSLEANRQTLAEMISQIRKYDPYPCIFGIPVMPALFATSKFYIFIGFALIGSRVMLTVLHNM